MLSATAKVVSRAVFCRGFLPRMMSVNPSPDYFTLLGIKASFDINQNELKKNFTSLQRVLHPDKFATKSQKEQEESLEMSSRVNQAFKTLQDPHSRGLYLLSLQGVEVKEDESDSNLRGSFLEEVMDMNERVAEAREGQEDKLTKLRTDINNTMNQLEKNISEVFRREPPDLEECKQLLIRYKFYQKLSKSLRQKED